MNLQDVLAAAPATPPCFPDRLQWAAYLLAAMDVAKSSGRPFDPQGAFRPSFNFCADCTREQAQEMDAQDRCKPSMFRAIPVKTLGAIA